MGCKMKEKNGFTLPEMLAALAILGIIMAIVIPAVGSNLNSAAKEYYKTQEGLLLLAAKDYFTDYRSKLPSTSEDNTFVTLDTLIDETYIGEILDDKKKPCDTLNSQVIVTYQGIGNYTYEVKLVCDRHKTGK